MSNSIGSSRPTKTFKNFYLKTKFNKTILLRQLMSRQAIHTRSQFRRQGITQEKGYKTPICVQTCRFIIGSTSSSVVYIAHLINYYSV
jgi:hypothetical protein